MKLSVITCFHNSAQQIPAYVSSLKNLNLLGVDAELVWVDNGSNDSTHNDLQHLLKSLPLPGKLLRELRPGLMYARCAGVAASTGDYVVFFDDDNEPNKDYLKNVLELILKFPAAKAFSGNAILPPEYDPPAGIRVALPFLAIRNEKGEAILPMDSLAPRLMPLGAGMAVHTQSIREACEIWLQGSQKIVGRTGTQPIGGEEIWLIHYITRTGESVVFSDRLQLIHRVGKQRFDGQYLCRLGFEYGQVQPRLIEEIRKFKPHLNYVYPDGRLGVLLAACRVISAVLNWCRKPSSGHLVILAHRFGLTMGLAHSFLRKSVYPKEASKT